MEISRRRPVGEEFAAEPWDFEFFQAIRVLERLRPGSAPLAEGPEAEKEAVRLRANVSLAFPAGEIQGFEAASTDLHPESDSSTELHPSAEPPVLTVNLMGLAGLDGPLPFPDVELAIQRTARGDTAMRDFLDIFNHRLLSLLARIERAHHPAFDTGSPDLGQIARYLFSLIGLGLPELRGRMRIEDRGLLYYAGILARPARPASGLERILADFFGVPAAVRQMAGRWRTLDPEQWPVLGRTGRNRELGRTALLGTRYWDQAGQFEVELGPMDQGRFHDFLPGSGGYEALCALTRFYAGADFEFTFALVLRAGEIPAARLDRRAALGWTSWMTRPAGGGGDVRIRVSPSV